MEAAVAEVTDLLRPTIPPPSDDPPPAVYDSTVTVSVYILNKNAIISISAPGTLKDSYTLYASQEENCEVDNYESCTEGEMHSLSAAAPFAKVTALTATTTAYFTLKNENSGVSRNFTVAQHPPFTAREDHQVVVFQGKLWLIGGNVTYDPDEHITIYGRHNDVWSSEDGATWTRVTTREPIFHRSGKHQVVVFKEKLWLIGGTIGGKEVWSSADGST